MARRWQHGRPSSAAQPALASDRTAQPVSFLPGGAAQPTLLSDGAEQTMLCELPESTKELAVGFYNVGVCVDEIGERGWKIKQRRLKTDIVKAFDVHALDVLCLSALGQLNESLDNGLEESAGTWIKSLMSSGMHSSAAQPALASDGAAQPTSLPGGAAQPTLLPNGTERQSEATQSSTKQHKSKRSVTALTWKQFCGS